jgi:hypothetical protein
MAVKQAYGVPNEEWPTADELSERLGVGKMAILPDRVERTGDGLIAAFRRDAQEIRVTGKEAGLEVELYSPPDARLGVYEEHAADWVLPTVVSFPLSIAGTLVANLIQTRIDAWKAGRSEGEDMPVVRYRELDVDGDQTRLREIEGPADQVRDILRDRDDGAREVNDE